LFLVVAVTEVFIGKSKSQSFLGSRPCRHAFSLSCRSLHGAGAGSYSLPWRWQDGRKFQSNGSFGAAVQPSELQSKVGGFLALRAVSKLVIVVEKRSWSVVCSAVAREATSPLWNNPHGSADEKGSSATTTRVKDFIMAIGQDYLMNEKD